MIFQLKDKVVYLFNNLLKIKKLKKFEKMDDFLNTTVQFSDKELELLQNRDFLLSKRFVTQKLQNLLGQLSLAIKATPTHQQFAFPQEMDYLTGKISKGENYQGLPYLVLDFPRLFQKEDIFTFRSMIWWGYEFSFTLHLGGCYQQKYATKLLATLANMTEKEIFVGVNETPWQYYFDTDNYLPLSQIKYEQLEQHIKQKSFSKISRKCALSDWQHAIEYGTTTYELFFGMLGDS